MFGCCAKKCHTKAQVVDNALVLSLTVSGKPVLWRVGMERLTTASFAVEEKADGSALVLKDGDGKTETIAVFDKSKEADRALESVTAAMMHGAGGTGRKRCGWFRKLLWLVFILFVIYFALVALSHLGTHGMDKTARHPAQNEKSVAPVQSGVPVPADKLFGGN